MIRKNYLLMAMIATLVCFGIVPATQAQADTTWAGEYFTNPSLACLVG